MSVITNHKVFLRRTELYGKGRIRGTTLDKEGQPIARVVQLWVQSTGPSRDPRLERLYMVTRSALSSGNWTFDNIDEGLSFTVIAHDHTKEYDPVMKTNLKPEPME